MRFLKLLFIIIILLFLSVSNVNAQPSVTAYFFYGNGCPHCTKEREFLETLIEKYPQLELRAYEIYYDQINNAILKKVAENLEVEARGVPFLVIGDQSFVGYAQGITSSEIEDQVTSCINNGCRDRVSGIVQNSGNPEIVVSTSPPTVDTPTIQDESTKKQILVPIIGGINVNNLSLPMLTIVLAFLDGFNPCAMWTLLFLISLLLGMKDKKRMWILGTAFIVSSAFVYFLFLSAWLNLFLFLGFVVWIRALIGILALFAGGYYLWDFWKNKSGGCNVMGSEKRQRIFKKLQTITQKRQLIFALTGIILLAIAVNMVELVCSAGLPAIYTQILSLSELATWQYYLYLCLYILVFMLDDLFVFFTAMITLQAVGVQSKYARFSHLIGGFLMAGIGLLLLFKPEWLMFG